MVKEKQEVNYIYTQTTTLTLLQVILQHKNPNLKFTMLPKLWYSSMNGVRRN